MTRVTANDRLIVLCERLAAATRAGAAEWRDEGNDTYLWQNGDGTVRIGARDGDDQPPYRLAIANQQGARVEEVESALVENDLPAPWNEPLADLYRAARRSALKADELIDALIAALPKETEKSRSGQTAPLAAE